MTQTPATRILDDLVLPAPGVWAFDPSHTDVSFLGRHLMLTKVRGRFAGVDGEVHVGDRPEDSSVKATIDMASVDTGFEIRDDNLRSSDHFDVEKFPVATFASTEITWDGSKGRMRGDLTIKDVTRPVDLDLTFLGHARDPWGGDRVGFEARGKIDRQDWGLSWNQLLESGGLMVSNEIELDLHIELVPAT